MELLKFAAVKRFLLYASTVTKGRKFLEIYNKDDVT